MNETFVLELLGELPSTLREQVANFMAFADEAAEAIYESLGLEPSVQTLNDFVALAGIWRLWRMIDAPFQLAQAAVRLLNTTSAREFELGASLYSAQSEPVRILSSLRSGLEAALVQAELSSIPGQRSLRDVALFAYSVADG